MPTFNDSKGRAWPVAITVGTLRRAKAAGLDLAGAIGPKGEPAALFADPDTFAALMLVLCEPATKGVAEEEFFEAMDGDAVEAAAQAFHEAVTDFTQPSPVRGPAKAKAKELYAAATAMMIRRIDSLTLSGSASGSPGSSASTPTATPSAN